MKERVKFYSENDLCYGWHLDKIATMEIPNINDITINDAIEFYEIKRYLDAGVRLKIWNDEQVNDYKDKSIKLDSLCKQFFNQLEDENILSLYETIEFGYHSEFWLLYDICKLYNKISDDAFSLLIEHERVSPYDLFKHKSIVKKYGKTLREYILRNEFCVPVILHIYEQDYIDGDKLVVPEELTGQDISSYLDAYIDCEHPNTNYLLDIQNMSYSKQFPITDEIRLKAKRRYETKIEELFKTGAQTSYGYQISFNSDQDEEIMTNNHNKDETNCFNISYSTKYLEETLDYPSILNNFIYIFEFADCNQMRSLHVSKKTQSGVFEDIYLSKSSRYYCCNSAFKAMNTVASMQMILYCEFLQKNDIMLEDVLLWFFTEYLQEEFSCPEIRVSFPSKGTTYSEKCSTIITAFETIIKQYLLYVRNGCIDFDLVAMSTTPISFKNVGSIVKNKYVYGNGTDFTNLTNMLFSNQNLLSHLNRIYEEGRHYNSFFDLLSNEEIFLSDYREEEKSCFEYLSNFDVISIAEDGKIQQKNKEAIVILHDLYKNDVISKKHLSRNLQKCINELISKGVLVEEDTLFSRPEIDYLNYMLNRSEFVNGKEIRNRYVHGIQHVNINEDEHKRNYYILLRLFVLLAIKINDEFCIKDIEDTLNNK